MRMTTSAAMFTGIHVKHVVRLARRRHDVLKIQIDR
jgi:hypothetical protein